jgi:hypothetical protein
MSIENLHELQIVLAVTSHGAVTNSHDIAQTLARCWHELEGSSDGGMDGSKICSPLYPYNRMECVTFDPPFLRFDIERHGATVNGSTRGEVQSWVVNVEKGTADLEKSRRRQLYPPAKKLDCDVLASEIAGLVASNGRDNRLKWKAPDQVRILMNKVIPATNAQTTSGRRKRFWKAFEQEAALRGWQRTGRDTISLRTAGAKLPKG